MLLVVGTALPGVPLMYVEERRSLEPTPTPSSYQKQNHNMHLSAGGGITSTLAYCGAGAYARLGHIVRKYAAGLLEGNSGCAAVPPRSIAARKPGLVVSVGTRASAPQRGMAGGCAAAGGARACTLLLLLALVLPGV